MDSVDRISELPDPILCHILSFLPTKFSIATSVLARRWKFLWADVLTLDLNGRDHRQKFAKFSGVIDRFLLRRNEKVTDTFRLRLSPNDFQVSKIDYRMERWICTAIARKVQKLELDLDYSLVMLPRCLWTCKTLVELSLRRCKVFAPKMPGPVCFPVLKKLYLDSVQHKNEEAFGQLISGCPVLEELTIHKIDQDLFCYNISSPTIKRLIIKLEFDTKSNYKPDYRLEINAPALKYLKLEDRVSEHISSHMLSFLREADICIKNEKNKQDEDDYSDCVVEFVDQLCNVNFLKLSIDHAEFYCSNFTAKTIRFDNLTKLELSADWRFMTMFLETAYNLKFLVISQVDDEDLKCWMEPEQVPICLLLHLNTVRIDSFRYADDEFEMVRYLLRNAQVLNTMEIYFDTKFSFEWEKSSAIERISQFERGSCEFDFH